jgi:hypothetical protein
MRAMRQVIAGISAISAVCATFVLGSGQPAQAQPGAAQPPAHAAAAPAQGFTAVAPTRLLDTRTNATTHTLGQGQTVSVTVTGVAAVPGSGVEAVVLNLTGIAHTHSSYLTVFPAGGSRPRASNLNLAIEQPRANQVIAQVAAGGQVSVFNSTGSTDVLVDITGYFVTGSSYSGQAPVRVLDTRALPGGHPIAAGHTTTVQLTGRGGVPTTGVTAVVLNLTGISTLAGAYLTAYPAGTTRPATSNLNLAAKQTAAVLVVAKPNASGQVTLYNSGGPTHVIVDVAGWFTLFDDYEPVTPTRLLDSRQSGALGYGADTQLQVGNFGNIPLNAGAVVLSVTAVKPAARGFLTLHPGGTPRPGTSSLNVEAGAIAANLVVVQLSTDAKVAIYDAARGAGVLVDVVGWIATNQALTVPTPVVGPGEATQPYSLSLSHEAGVAPYTWALAAGALPAGLSLAVDGTISGTPTAAGATAATIRVRDSTGEAVDRALTFKIYPFVSQAAWAWGAPHGWLQAGISIPAGTSHPVNGLSGVAALSLESGVGFALMGDGTVRGWGEGQTGLIGDGGHTSGPTPLLVSGLSGVTALASAATTTYALKSDGTVWAWGANTWGELGIGSSTALSLVPVQISALTSVSAIGAGTHTGYAVKTDGSVWAWGAGGSGQLGDGSVTAKALTPVQVSGLTGVASVAGGPLTSYAVKTDGTVWAWGAGSQFQLGDGTNTAAALTPVQVSGLTGATEVDGGALGACALTSAGTVWCWGSGLLGSDPFDPSVPEEVTGLTDAIQIATAASTTYALSADGTTWSWGQDLNGGLGRGPIVHSDTPGKVLVPPLTSITANPAVDDALGVGKP